MTNKNNIRFVQGNEACVEGALYAGLNFFAGYPITPSTEIMEHLKKDTSTIGHDGKFKASHTNEILSYYREFDKINLKNSHKENKIFKFTNSKKQITRYRFFNFKNLEWVIISE